MRELDGCTHLCTRTTAQDGAEKSSISETQMRRQATRGGLKFAFWTSPHVHRGAPLVHHRQRETVAPSGS